MNSIFDAQGISSSAAGFGFTDSQGASIISSSSELGGCHGSYCISGTGGRPALLGAPLALAALFGAAWIHLLVDLIQVELDEPKKSDMIELLAVPVSLGKKCEVLGFPHHVLERLPQVRLAKVDRTLAQFAERHLHDILESLWTVRIVK